VGPDVERSGEAVEHDASDEEGDPREQHKRTDDDRHLAERER